MLEVDAPSSVSRNFQRSRVVPKNPLVSVVVSTRNEGKNLKRTVELLIATAPQKCEILVVDDGSDDGSCEQIVPSDNIRIFRSSGLGVTRARNYGALRAKGEIVVFVDAHVDAPTDWWPTVVELLGNPVIGAVAPAISVMNNPTCVGYGLKLDGADLSAKWLNRDGPEPYPVPILPGCFLAMRRDTFGVTGGFDDGMKTWGMSDIELSIRFWTSGLEMWVIPSVVVPHLFRQTHPYRVDWTSTLHNRLRTAFIHFGSARAARVIKAIENHREFSAAVDLIERGNASARRGELARNRVHDDDWYFTKFSPDI